MALDPYCNHQWMREDMNTKQCVHCHGYAEIEGDEFE